MKNILTFLFYHYENQYYKLNLFPLTAYSVEMEYKKTTLVVTKNSSPDHIVGILIGFNHRIGLLSLKLRTFLLDYTVITFISSLLMEAR